MNCPNCHKPIPARARYCIHCGAEQEATPIAAVAAEASTARGRREAANAAHAEAIPEVAPLPASSAAIVELPSAARARDPQVASDPVTRPAYADAPPRRTLAVSLAVACFAVGIVAAATAWWFQENARTMLACQPLGQNRAGEAGADDQIVVTALWRWEGRGHSAATSSAGVPVSLMVPSSSAMRPAILA